MSEPLDLTTELEAVNAILASVGESPITSFDGQFVDAELARTMLTQESRALQTKGWTWNTDKTMSFTPDLDGKIQLPRNILRMKFESLDLTRRGQLVYDRVNHTYTFTSAVTASEVVTMLVYEDLPEAARRFTYMRAGRRFQDRLGGDQVLHQFHERDELSAWAALLNDEAEVAQYNVLSNSSLVARIKGRR